MLGGTERDLKFGTMGFFKHVGKVFSGDPLDLVNGSATPAKQYEVILACIYAGLKCAGGKDTPEQVDTWVQELEFDEAARVMKAFQEAHASGNGKAGETQARELVEVV